MRACSPPVPSSFKLGSSHSDGLRPTPGHSSVGVVGPHSVCSPRAPLAVSVFTHLGDRLISAVTCCVFVYWGLLLKLRSGTFGDSMMGVWHSVNNCFLGSLNAAESCVRPRLWLLSWPFASSEAATGISCGSSLWGSFLLVAFGIQLQNCLSNHRGMVSAVLRGCPSDGGTISTWLILPVVICLSQRLSHACLSISFYTAKLRMAH